MNSDVRMRELASINWTELGSAKHPVDCVDAKEFLRRAASFLVKEGISGQNPFFNVAEIFNVAFPDELLREVNRTVSTEEFPLAKRISAFHVLVGNIDHLDAGEIYSPLMSIFRRGGSIDYHSGELIVDDEWAIPLRGWVERFSSSSP